MENINFGSVSNTQLVLMLITAVLGMAIPLVIAIVWCRKKHEPFTTVLIGAATFMLFAIVIEKPLQALVISLDSPVSRFVNATPVLWGFIVGLFPGVFEETGRFVAFKTVLRKRKQNETGLSHGIGHGGFEAMFILGITYIEYFIFGLMINNGSFASYIAKSLGSSPSPEVTKQVTDVVTAISTFNAGAAGLAFIDRALAVLFHIGASILVFYAANDKKKRWLYPFAIVIHTVIDGFLGLQLAGVFTIPSWLNEVIFALEAIGVFAYAYFCHYRKAKALPAAAAEGLDH